MSRCISFLLALGMLVGSAAGTAYTVTYSDAPIWTVGTGVTYPDLSITLGETLKFVSHTGHDVVLLSTPSSGTHWDQCGMGGIPSGASATIWTDTDFSANTEKHYTPPTCGDFYIACSVGPHCAYGQRIKVTVNNADASACASPCAGAACVTEGSKLSATSGTVHDVKPAPKSGYWGTGPYNALTVELGDTVLFRTAPGFHDVATVPTLTDLNSCDVSRMTVLADWTPMVPSPSLSCNSSSTCCAGSSCGTSGMSVTYSFTAETAGDTYFVCSIGGGFHCKTGQKFHLTVNAAADPPVTDADASSAGRSEVYQFIVFLGLVPSMFMII